MCRRSFLASTLSLIFTNLATAQPPKKWRLGYLAPGMPDDGALMKVFLEGLRELGYVEDQNILIERRTADGRFEKLDALAEQLVQAKVDIIIAPTTPAARAARRATASIPIVFTIVSDPVGSRLVTSFSHPGGNVTGVTDMDVALAEKRLDMLKQLLPRLKRVGALGDPSDKVWEPEWKQAQEAAKKLRLDIMSVLVTTPDELEAAFVGLNRRVDALLIAPQAFFAVHSRSVIELESRAKLPAIHERRVFPDAGALISYGPGYAALLRKTARYVDKILKGAKPADLPVEQPTEYELVINLRTAKALGIIIPESVLARADGVIR